MILREIRFPQRCEGLMGLRERQTVYFAQRTVEEVCLG